jgi:hypothetical protein
MGFFSSIFGGGGSSSSSAQTNNNITVNPVTNLDLEFNTEELARAIQQGNANEYLTATARNALLKEGLTIDNNTLLFQQQANAEAQEIEKVKLLLDNESLNQNKKIYDTLGSFTPLIAVSIIYFVFIKKRSK